jgi:hypothetical protein
MQLSMPSGATVTSISYDMAIGTLTFGSTMPELSGIHFWFIEIRQLEPKWRCMSRVHGVCVWGEGLYDHQQCCGA